MIVVGDRHYASAKAGDLKLRGPIVSGAQQRRRKCEMNAHRRRVETPAAAIAGSRSQRARVHFCI